MGQKTHPIGFRLKIVKTWNSKWFESTRYREWLHQDLKLRRFLKRKLYGASISEITIERAANKVKVNIFSARPGIIIGKRGAGVEALKREVQKLTDSDVYLNIQEVRKAEVNAQLVAENITQQLERRIAFRRALKRAVQTAMKFGAKGIRVNAAGRLGNSEMGRREWYLEGRIPLHTLRADIDYGFAIAKTSGGTAGVKCWIFKGEVFDHREKGQQDSRFPTPQSRGN
jgi:small subunit ribosomal protein S3